MKEKLEERAVVLNQILEEQNTGIQLVYTKQFSHNEECEGYIVKQKEAEIAPIVYISPDVPDWWEGTDQEVAKKFLEFSKSVAGYSPERWQPFAELVAVAVVLFLFLHFYENMERYR